MAVYAGLATGVDLVLEDRVLRFIGRHGPVTTAEIHAEFPDRSQFAFGWTSAQVDAALARLDSDGRASHDVVADTWTA